MKTIKYLTFVGEQCGKASEAINFYTSTLLHFYTSIFPNSQIKNIINYDEGEAGGTPALIKYSVFTLNGTENRLSESNHNHAWSFSRGVSLFVDCETEQEIQTLFEQLSSNGGQVMVPLDHYESGDYGISKKYGWCADKYGISWQLNLSQ